MKLTNTLNLPQPLADAVANDDYSPGESDITVTSLLDPPQKVELTRRHGAQMSEDVSDRIWSLFGQAVHTVLERAEREGIAEERLYVDCLGWKVGGKFDRLALVDKDGQRTLQDYKFVSTWEATNGPKPERQQQLSLLAYLARKNGYAVERTELVYIFRDWKKPQARRDQNYPQRGVLVYFVPMWDDETAERFLQERVRLHQFARGAQVIAPCTDEERWAEPPTFAVMKNRRKTALRVKPTWEEAYSWAEEKGHCEFTGVGELAVSALAKDISIVKRPGNPVKRCEDYCSVGMSGFCPQFNALSNSTEEEADAA